MHKKNFLLKLYGIFLVVRVNISGTDWVMVTTSDGKKYYHNSKTKVWIVCSNLKSIDIVE